MAPLPILRIKAILGALLRAGFRVIRSKGSHFRLEHYVTRRLVTIALHHGDVPRGTLKSILKQAGMTVEQFLKYLK